MADTTISPNNQLVRYRGRKERTMPNVSQAQRGAMAAAAEGKSKLGISKEVGEEYMDADEGGKLPPKAPKKKAPPKDRSDRLAGQGLISDEQLAKAKKKLGPKIAPAPIAKDEADGDPDRD